MVRLVRPVKVCEYRRAPTILPRSTAALHWVGRLRRGSFTLKKLECSKQAYAVNTLAWNNKIGLWFYFVGF